jgi:hypothetical protein
MFSLIKHKFKIDGNKFDDTHGVDTLNFLLEYLLFVQF